MTYPKINFVPMTLEENIAFIKWAYFAENNSLDIHQYTIKCFPELQKIDSTYSKEEIEKKLLKAEKQIEEGKTVKAAEVFKELEEKYGF